MPKRESSDARVFDDWTGTWVPAGPEHAERVARHEETLNPPPPPAEAPRPPAIGEVDGPVVTSGGTAGA